MMAFNVSYDVAALVFLLIICWQFFTQRQFPLLSNRFFALFLLLAVLSLSLDIGGTLMLHPALDAPLWLCYTVNVLYYVVQLLFPSVLTMYILARADCTDRLGYLAAMAPPSSRSCSSSWPCPWGWCSASPPAGCTSTAPSPPSPT